jgi:hypothetical protein
MAHKRRYLKPKTLTVYNAYTTLHAASYTMMLDAGAATFQ